MQADELLKSVKKIHSRQGQGKLKIFMGMVAGVGKTFAMLKSAHALKERGQAPLVGFVETHGRAETEALIQDLEVLPRLRISYKDVVLEEFDIDSCLALRPGLVLIDELAHTNAPGSRHQKRWQDVLEILHQGIDVYTTLNVQHVESRSETISSFTGVRVAELVPDSILDRADEIVLIDLIPDEVILRLTQGKIYATEKIDVATQNFFKVSNLTALREVALRLMAERVDHELKDLSLIQGIGHVKTHHKIMVAIFGSPYSESLIRYARKMAYGLNCPWYAGFVSNRVMGHKESELLDRNMELVKRMGGEVMITQNESVANGLLFLAQQYGASQIIVGHSDRKGFLPKLPWKKPLSEALVMHSRGIDITVISPTEKLNIEITPAPKTVRRDYELDWRSILTTTGYLANITFINAILLPVVHYRAIGIIYLMGITIGPLFIKRYNIYLATVLGGVCWNVFFIPPRFTLAIKAQDDWMLLLLYIVAGIVIGRFTKKLQEKEEILRQEGSRATQLYSITKELSQAQDIQGLIQTVHDQIFRLFGCASTVFIRSWNQQEYDPLPQDGQGPFLIPAKEEYALRWVLSNRLPAGRFTDTLPASLGHYIPLLSEDEVVGIIAIDVSLLTFMGHDQRILLDALARQLATGIERENLEHQLRGKLVSEESEKIYKTLLNSVSHEIRIPLSAIKGFSLALKEIKENDRGKIEDIANEISQGADRLDYVVQNLLDMSRLESGMLKLNLDYVDIVELIHASISKVKHYHGSKDVIFSCPQDLPLLYLDYFFIEQSIENIIRNAFLYTPIESPLEIEIKLDDKKVFINLTDYGPGIDPKDTELVFKKFYRAHPEKTGGLGLGLSICKAIIEMHQGKITVRNIPNKGACFEIELPRELDRDIL